jgi:tRNA dimethylallyltransferase
MPVHRLPIGTILFLAGPTASGKSSAAARLAAAISGEVVCADAFQLLAGLPILTAQPDATDLATAPHHLYGSIPLGTPMDAGRFAALASPVIADILARGHTPIVTGGSGLYLKALSHSLAPLPPANPAVRTEIDALPPEAAVARLLDLDPAAATTVNLRNPRHVQRALEISLLTGQPASALRTSFQSGPLPASRGVVLTRERPDLHHRIALRTQSMLALGVLDEVSAAATATNPAPTCAIGFSDFLAAARGTLPLTDAIAAVTIATRQYAKRQDSWFRRESWMTSITAAPHDSPDLIAQRIADAFNAPPPAV